MDLALPQLRTAARRSRSEGLLVEGLQTSLNPNRPWQMDLPGEGIFGFSGTSGSGKSTLLAALAGQRACKGRITFGGTLWQDGAWGLAAHRRDLVLGFQDGRLFVGQNVADNLALAHRYSRRPLPGSERHELIRAFGIDHTLEQPVGQLSGGEVQRVALLRQLFSNAAVQLYDEPLSAVDRSKVIRQLLPTLRMFWVRHPALIFWTSHDFNEIQLLTTQCLWMNDGELFGPAGVIDVARRFGSVDGARHSCSSRLEARVESYEAGLLTLSLGDAFLYADRIEGNYKPGDQVAFLLDSGEISLSLARPGLSSILNCIAVELRGVMPLTDGRVRLQLLASDQLFCADISRLSYERLQLTEGGRYYAQFKAGSLAGL